MPAILTHDFFGKDVVGDVSDYMGFSHTDERDAFLLGNQGPDPLFYIVVSPRYAKWEPLGNVMHDARPAQLLACMRAGVDRLEGYEHDVARAYLAGFSCHWLLDSSMHPLVYYWQNGICSAGVEGLNESHGSRVHAEIERDFDEMVLYAKTGLTACEYHAHSHTLYGSSAVLSIIDKLYFYAALWAYNKPIASDTYTRALRDFRKVQNLFDSPSGSKREFLGTIERVVLREDYSLVCSMSHRARADDTSDFDNRDHGVWEHPFTHETSTQSFWDIYQGAQDRVMDTVRTVLSDGFDLDAAVRLTGNVNFEGAVSEPDAPVTW